MTSNKLDNIHQEKKLKRVKNWARWSNMTMLTLKKKEFWNIVMNNCIIEITLITIASYDQDAVRTVKIIKSDLNNNLFKNVKNINKSSLIWKQFHITCIQVEQNIVYAELHSLLLYLFMIKALNHEKFINTYFVEINNLIKKIKVTVSVKQDVWDNIVLITVLEELSEKYDSWKNYLLNQKKITIIDAQQILFSEEIWIEVNREVNVKLNWTLIIQEYKWVTKKTECYNCEELEHYVCDCIKWKHHTNDFTK